MILLVFIILLIVFGEDHWRIQAVKDDVAMLDEEYINAKMKLAIW